MFFIPLISAFGDQQQLKHGFRQQPQATPANSEKDSGSIKNGAVVVLDHQNLCLALPPDDIWRAPATWTPRKRPRSCARPTCSSSRGSASCSSVSRFGSVSRLTDCICFMLLVVTAGSQTSSEIFPTICPLLHSVHSPLFIFLYVIIPYFSVGISTLSRRQPPYLS